MKSYKKEFPKELYNIAKSERNFGQTYYEITKLLMRLNFNISSIGFQYWVIALIDYRKNYFKYDNTIERLYTDIAKNCNTTRSKVERGMRTASATAKKTIANDFNYYKKLSNKTILKLLTHNVCIINIKGE